MQKQTLIFSFLCLFVYFTYAQTSPEIIAKGKNKGKITVSTSTGDLNLFLETANMMRIDISGLTDKSNFNCSAKNAVIKQSSDDKAKFLVVPAKSPVTITVKNGKTKLGKIVYQVVEPPKPTLEWYLNGVKVENLHKAKKTDRLSVKVVPEKNFREKHPNDAKYAFSEMDIWLVEKGKNVRVGGADLHNKDAVFGLEVPIPTGFFDTAENEKVMVKVKSINRKTFDGNTIEDTRFTEEEKTFYLTK